jgi:DNA polymerase elongation subunit (family B)
MSVSVEFIVTEVTYTMDTSTDSRWGPVIRLYGRLDPDGRSVCVKVRDFLPYFYAQIARDGIDIFTKLESELRLATQAKDTSKFPPQGKSFISRIDPVERLSLMGYSPEGPGPMYRIVMTAPGNVKTAKNILEHARISDVPIITHEASIAFVLRFMIDTNIGGFSWLRIENATDTFIRDTTCDIELDAKTADIVARTDRSDAGITSWLYFDLEVCKELGKGYAPMGKNVICNIGAYLVTVDRIDQHVFCLVPVGKSVATPLPDHTIIVHIFESEVSMLLAFRDFIIDNNPDVMGGYNIDGYDWPTLALRAKELGIEQQFLAFTRDRKRVAKLKKSHFKSAGKGAREDYDMAVEGRFSFDVHKAMKDFTKERSYTLGAMSKKFLKNTKLDMPYDLIPVYFHGTDEQRAHLAYYCLIDCKLCHDLMLKCMFTTNYIGTARVCGVPMKFLLSRGQQVLTESLLGRFGQRRGVVLPTSTENQNKDKTKGAVVKDPIKGMYVKPIMTLDFQSLYPSIIMQYNICYSSKKSLAWLKANLKPDDYWVPPIQGCNFGFVKAHIWKGILPEMEETLFNLRKQAKEDMNKETDKFKKSILDALQNAIKVRMNSIYGFLKANKICDADLMSAVTAWGREMLAITTNIVETNFPGSRVIYGDSVTGDTPVLIRYKGRTCYVTIEDVPRSSKWDAEHGKEVALANGVEIWSDVGFTTIERIIRHFTNKHIIRVTTESGQVDVTTDHSLLRPNGAKVRPCDVAVGEELMHFDSFPTQMDDIPIEFDTKGSKIVSLEDLGPCHDYVYDLQTANHHFAAGVGKIVVHNTDSVFVDFGDNISMEKAFELGTLAANMCTKHFGRYIVLQREKCMNPYLLIGKKKYVGKKYLKLDSKPVLQSTGLESVRRDNALLASESLEHATNTIIMNGDHDGSKTVAYIHNVIRDVLMGRTEYHRLIVSKALSKTMDDYAKKGTHQPHVELAKRIAARAGVTGESIPQTGDRVKMVFVDRGKNAKAYEKAEDPLFAMKNRLPIDYHYYVFGQLLKPLLRIMIPILAPEESMKKKNAKGDSVTISQKEMEALRTYRILFTGGHMMQMVQNYVEGGVGIMKFTRRIEKCLHCGCQSQGPVCGPCGKFEQSTYMRLRNECNDAERAVWASWNACQVCSGQYLKKVDCANKDCDNFYRREKVVIDLEDLTRKVDRFEGSNKRK